MTFRKLMNVYDEFRQYCFDNRFSPLPDRYDEDSLLDFMSWIGWHKTELLEQSEKEQDD